MAKCPYEKCPWRDGEQWPPNWYFPRPAQYIRASKVVELEHDLSKERYERQRLEMEVQRLQMRHEEHLRTERHRSEGECLTCAHWGRRGCMPCMMGERNDYTPRPPKPEHDVIQDMEQMSRQAQGEGHHPLRFKLGRRQIEALKHPAGFWALLKNNAKWRDSHRGHGQIGELNDIPVFEVDRKDGIVLECQGMIRTREWAYPCGTS